METLSIQVGQAILQQLGGNKFKAMTGAHTFIASEDALTMHLPRNNAKAKFLRIELTSKDTYNMIFRGKLNAQFTFPEVERIEGVYCDQLQELFTKTTGLDTSL